MGGRNGAHLEISMKHLFGEIDLVPVTSKPFEVLWRCWERKALTSRKTTKEKEMRVVARLGKYFTQLTA